MKVNCCVDKVVAQLRKERKCPAQKIKWGTRGYEGTLRLLTLQKSCDAIRSPVKMGGWVTLQEIPVAGASSENNNRVLNPTANL